MRAIDLERNQPVDLKNYWRHLVLFFRTTTCQKSVWKLLTCGRVDVRSVKEKSCAGSSKDVADDARRRLHGAERRLRCHLCDGRLSLDVQKLSRQLG